MSVNLSIKNVPDAMAERLRKRALANHRSLQGELMAMLDRALGDSSVEQARAHFVVPETDVSGAGSVPPLLREALSRVSVAQANDTVRLVREMREERTEHLMRLIEREGAAERARSLLGLPPRATPKQASKPAAPRGRRKDPTR